MGDVDPKSVEMRISGFGLVPAVYDPKTKLVTYAFTQKLEASEVAYCLESRRGPAVLKLRIELQASHHPGGLLRCRAAHLRGYPPESR